MLRLLDLRMLLVPLGLTLVPASSLGRLGDSEQALAERFGSAVSSQPEKLVAGGRFVEFGRFVRFRQGDWSITCSIVQGRSAQESYRKSGHWTSDQILAVLNANAQGARWSEVSRPSVAKMAREWRRDDGGAARWQQGVGITVTHPACERAKAVARAKAEAEAARVPRL
ncbi:MAG: hypothetical protein SFV54_18530 [Bryobacteraceae bacterium]|nr:hypothetical protein [Bryobacteraceae bacterium]